MPYTVPVWYIAGVAEAGTHARWKAPQVIAPAGMKGQAVFAHNSERQLARLLDFYRIRWEYEPTSFPLAWYSHGAIKESFTPDFYLPDFDLYIELTTAKPELSARKKRKARRLQELYPHVRIRLFRLQDFKRLMLRYGIPHEKA